METLEIVPAPLRTVSHGGGVQTTALLVLAAEGKIDYRTFIFANVGEDSEHPGTLRYLEQIARPYASAHGIDIIEVRRPDGETVRGRIESSESGGVPIPLHVPPAGFKRWRSCTREFKIEPIHHWLIEHGASADNPATVAVGISLDEIHRANNRKAEPFERLDYPLLDLGLRRRDCQDIIRAAGLPLPGKSSCYFCPFQRTEQWRSMRRHEPELFASVADLEEGLNRRRLAAGKDPVFLSLALRPLAEAFTDNQMVFEEVDSDPHCDNGWCMT